MQYAKDFTDALQFMWGDGFLSPGGPEEVAEMLAGIDLHGKRVLDIGSGLGGVDLLLATTHGAAEVVGIDVEPQLVDSARALVAAKGLQERVSFQLVEPGSLPFADASFDVVFSKDAMVHIEDKAALYAEVLRVLKPGGWFTAADWLWAEGAAQSPVVEAWLSMGPLKFMFTPPAVALQAMIDAGFADVRVIDHRLRLQQSNRTEIAVLEGPARQRLAATVGETMANNRLAAPKAGKARSIPGTSSPPICAAGGHSRRQRTCDHSNCDLELAKPVEGGAVADPPPRVLRESGMGDGGAIGAKPTDFDPILLAVLSNRFESIIREMTNTVMKASRSSVIKNARDMSCGILTYDHRLVSVEEALPIHVTALELTTKPITELFDDIKEGDAFLNNSPFFGGTHHADLTLCVPVFCAGEPLFWTLARSHHADIGAPEPTTYLPYAKTIYEEGLHFPCVRIQEKGEDKADLIRMGHQKIRVSNIWYGDYRAQVGACRTGERRLKELADKYGIATIKAFIEAWMDYGERRAIAAIRQLPAGTLTYEVRHDPVPGVADKGVAIRAKVKIDPKAGLITVDVRDNPDCVEGGLNVSEACVIASCRTGVYYNIDSTIPHNHGSASRIVPLLRDNCVVGRPQHPIGTSCATSNVNERLANAVQCCFSQLGEPYGMAEGGGNFSAALGVVSGVDQRRKTEIPYITQLMLALSGGPGSYGHDGWLTYECAVGNGIMVNDSIEVDEATYPILIEERSVAEDSMGFGEFNGAPATKGSYRSLTGDLTVYYCGDGGTFAPKGVLGGRAGAGCGTWKRHRNGKLERLPDFHTETMSAKEAVHYRSCAGGGYGDPRQRDPARVLADINRRWLSVGAARKAFGVAVAKAPNGIDYVLDEVGTARLRKSKGQSKTGGRAKTAARGRRK